MQAVKDPMKTKGARLTTEISLPGRFLVFVPQGEGLGVSRRLEDAERARLKDIIKELDPKEGGIIVRTAAEGASAEDIQRDLVFLQRLWKTIQANAKAAKAPALVYQEAELPLRIVRDLFAGRLRARADRPRAHLQAHRRLPQEDLAAHGRARAPLQGEGAAVRGAPASTRRSARRSSGASTCRPAATSSSTTPRRSPSSTSTPAASSARARRRRPRRLEDTITKNNLEAVKEVVRQLRLRDIGGIIVIDFIDMANPKNRAAVEEALRTELERDRTKTYVVEISPLGLVEMTRQNVTDGPREILTRKCPTCEGDGIVVSEQTAALEVERRLRALAAGSRAQAFQVEVNPRTRALLAGPGAARAARARGGDEEAVLPRRRRRASTPTTRPCSREGKLADLAAGGAGRRGRRARAEARRARSPRRAGRRSASSTASTSSSAAPRSSSARRRRCASSASSTASPTRRCSPAATRRRRRSRSRARPRSRPARPRARRRTRRSRGRRGRRRGGSDRRGGRRGRGARGRGRREAEADAEAAEDAADGGEAAKKRRRGAARAAGGTARRRRRQPLPRRRRSSAEAAAGRRRSAELELAGSSRRRASTCPRRDSRRWAATTAPRPSGDSARGAEPDGGRSAPTRQPSPVRTTPRRRRRRRPGAARAAGATARRSRRRRRRRRRRPRRRRRESEPSRSPTPGCDMPGRTHPRAKRRRRVGRRAASDEYVPMSEWLDDIDS